MGIVAKKQRGFEPPAEGAYPAVLVDVIDMGEYPGEWDGKKTSRHLIRLLFQAEDPATGRRFFASRVLTLSMHEKSTMWSFFEIWRGRRYSEEELENGFDVETMIGECATVRITHARRGGRVYANVQHALPYAQDRPRLEPENYTRESERAGGYGGDGGVEGETVAADGRLI